MNILTYFYTTGALVISTAGMLPAAIDGLEDRPAAIDGLEDRTFQSVTVTQDGQARPLLPDTVIRLRIADGGLLAHAGGNLISGQVSVEGARLVVSGLRTTDLPYSPDHRAQDTWLGQFFAAGPTWTQHEGELLLRVDGTEIRLAGQPETTRPLVDTYWIVESASRPGTAPVPARVHAHLVFHDDEVNGGLSCNWIGGWAAVGDGTIVFAGMGTTKRMCPQEDIMLEIAIFDVLEGEVSFDLGVDRLELTGADGRSLQLRAAF